MTTKHAFVAKLVFGWGVSLTVLSACGAPRRSAVQPSTTTPTGADVEAPAPAAGPSVAAGGVLAAGAALRVRVVDEISTEGAKPGTPFESTLASAIRDSDGTEILPEGTKVYGRVMESEGGGAVRKPRLTIGLTSIEAPGKTVSIATNVAGAEGGHGGAAKKVGAGMLIGAAAGNVGAGAAVGGAAVLLSGKNQIVIPKGTLVEFNLTQPARLR